MRRFGPFLVAAVLCIAGAATLFADEGMWTLDHLPVQQLQDRYGFTPAPQWIDRVQHAAVRLAGGCSGSFVSGDGLVMTNHHCANACLQQLSTATADYMRDGFVEAGEEPRCPDVELNQLESMTDVTDRVNAATAGRTGAARTAAERAIDSALEQDCVGGDPETWRCDVVSLYHGGRYSLYKYRRYQDVRLVFAPENAIAFFGGDPDNFNFPRYDLDVTFLRAYVDGRPARTPQYLPFDARGPKAGDLTFVVGNPGSTSRDLPWSSLTELRDRRLTPTVAYGAELRGVLWEYTRRGAEEARHARDDLFTIENALKVYTGQLAALDNEALAARKQQADRELKAWIDADPSRVAAYGDPWATLARAQARAAEIRDEYNMIEGSRGPLGFLSVLFEDARLLVRGAAERAKPDASRLPEFRDANLPAVRQALAADVPIYAEYEDTRLAWSLEKLRQKLGADDAFVHLVLGDRSPDQVAHALVSGTALADRAVRQRLWDGGAAAVDASTDPMIVLARTVDPEARRVRQIYEDEVAAPTTAATEALARARFARDGLSSYPDATFTLRLSYGKVVGWDEKGTPVPPFTEIAGLYRRATGAPPYALPDRWIAAKDALDLSTPMNFVTDNDVIGGNSGSPVINREGHVVGLIFDGNIHSLGGDFGFDERTNRSVAVDTAAIAHALDRVYHRPELVGELTSGRRSGNFER
jgi:hypothetical protein